MIWLSAEEALMSTRPSACGPSAMPATRKIATSGTPIFCATKAASVPIARTRPQASSVCWAMAIEADDSICRLFQRLHPCGNLAHGHILGNIQEVVESPQGD